MSSKPTAEKPADAPLAEALDILAAKALEVLAGLKERGEVKALYYEAQRLVLDDFDYTENGVQITQSGMAREERPVWHPAQQAVYHLLLPTPAFREAERCLTEAYLDTEDPKWPLERFVDRIVDDALGAAQASANVKAVQKRLTAELDRRPVAQKAVAELYSLVVLGCDFAFESQGIEFRLRPTRREDLERQHGHIAFGMPYQHGYPGAMLEISLLAQDHLALQGKVEEAVNVLRLFRPVAVSYLGYRVESPAVIPRVSGMYIGGGRRRGRGECPGRLYPSDDLVAFWQRIHQLVAHSLLLQPGQSPNPLQIAFGRYLDALWSPTVPQRIATAVMGIEALLSDGPGGSKYKLAVRVAKLLSKFGLPAVKVRRLLEEAYRVRSGFVHGRHFDAGSRDRLADRAGDAKRFILLLLNYLRLCLVTCLVVDVEKNKLLRLVDDALVDGERDQQLAAVLEVARPLCRPGLK